MKHTRRSFLSAFAGLPIVGRLVKEPFQPTAKARIVPHDQRTMPKPKLTATVSEFKDEIVLRTPTQAAGTCAVFIYCRHGQPLVMCGQCCTAPTSTVPPMFTARRFDGTDVWCGRGIQCDCAIGPTGMICKALGDDKPRTWQDLNNTASEMRSSPDKPGTRQGLA